MHKQRLQVVYIGRSFQDFVICGRKETDADGPEGSEIKSGTTDNLLIDDMVVRDAQINKRNLSCAWIDVTKAFDSVSHSWLVYALRIHRIPTKLQTIIISIIEKWNVRIKVMTRDI